jgi:hypothetical protein
VGFNYVPPGTEDTLFGDGVIVKVTVAWDSSVVKLYLNDNLVQVSRYSPAAGNWTMASVFALGAYEYLGAGGCNTTDDTIDEFTVSGK